MNNSRHISHICLISILVFVCVFAGFRFARAADDEAFLEMRSELLVHDNGDVSATETMRVRSLAIGVKHGIYREYVTVYPDGEDESVRLEFIIKSVLRDGRVEPYHTVETEDGLKLYAGQEDVLLKPGIYTYEFAYDKKDELAEIDDRRILFWYPTGVLGMPAEHVSVAVRLPDGVDPSRVLARAFNDIDVEDADMFPVKYHEDKGIWYFESDRPLVPGEQFIVFVSWPKNEE